MTNITIFQAIRSLESLNIPTSVTNISDFTNLLPNIVASQLKKNINSSLIFKDIASQTPNLEEFDDGSTYTIVNNSYYEQFAIQNGCGYSYSADNSNATFTIHGFELITEENLKSLLYFMDTTVLLVAGGGQLLFTITNHLETYKSLRFSISGSYINDPQELITVFLSFMRQNFPSYIDLDGQYPSYSEIENILESHWKE